MKRRRPNLDKGVATSTHHHTGWPPTTSYTGRGVCPPTLGCNMSRLSPPTTPSARGAACRPPPPAYTTGTRLPQIAPSAGRGACPPRPCPTAPGQGPGGATSSPPATAGTTTPPAGRASRPPSPWACAPAHVTSGTGGTEAETSSTQRGGPADCSSIVCSAGSTTPSTERPACSPAPWASPTAPGPCTTGRAESATPPAQIVDKDEREQGTLRSGTASQSNQSSSSEKGRRINRKKKEITEISEKKEVDEGRRKSGRSKNSWSNFCTNERETNLTG